MRYTRLTIIGVLGFCGSVLLLVPASAQQPNLETLDIPALLRTSDRNGAAQHQRLVEYTYLQKRITREIGPQGKTIVRVREFEAYPIKAAGQHRHILSLIRKDGVPVTAKQLEQNRELAAREIAAAENVAPTASTTEKYITAGIGLGPAGEGVWLGVSQFLRQCQFDTPHLTRLGDRETIQLTMRSCRSDSASPRENYVTNLTGIVWIDAADKVVVRLEAWLAGPNVARPTDEVIVYEQQRVRDALWAPRRIWLNGIGKAALFNGVHKDMTFEFTDYQYFSTEIKDKEVIAPPKKPPQ